MNPNPVEPDTGSVVAVPESPNFEQHFTGFDANPFDVELELSDCYSVAPPVTGDVPVRDFVDFGQDHNDVFDGSSLVSDFGANSNEDSQFMLHSNFDDWNVVDDGIALPLQPAASDRFSDATQTDFEAHCNRGLTDVANRDPVISESRHNAMFARDLLTNCSAASSIVLPWEQGIFREIFSDEPLSNVIPLMPLQSELGQLQPGLEPQLAGELVASATMYETQNPMFMDVISTKDDLGYADKMALIRERALSKLLVVVEYSLEASSTGRRIAELGGGQSNRTDAFSVIDAVVGLRSPNTVTKRANSLLGFLAWISQTRDDGQNPFREEVVWRYLRHLRETGAAPTKGESVMSAVRFARYILGFESLDSAVNSRRLIGICELMAAGKRILRQARVLHVSQVLQLHRLRCDQNMHLCDRAICAYILLALYGRCRRSDLQMIKSVECDFTEHGGGFVVLQTACHKTGRSSALKSKLLPVIIPARGVDGTVYAGVAIGLLEQCGLVIGSNIDGPLLRAPTGVTQFLKRGMTSHEVSMSLRKLLGVEESCSADADDVVSSHSLKATCLSWCAKYGLSPNTRSMLGRHATILGETFAIYSRDLMVAPAVELQTVIDDISKGAFSPDGPRSSFFAAKGSMPVQESPTVKVEHDGLAPLETGLTSEVIDVHDSGESSSEDDSEGVSSSEEEMPPGNVHRVKRYRAKIDHEEMWFSHKKSKILHKKDYDTSLFWDRDYLFCGKMVTDMYERCTEVNGMNTLCRVCLRRS